MKTKNHPYRTVVVIKRGAFTKNISNDLLFSLLFKISHLYFSFACYEILWPYRIRTIYIISSTEQQHIGIKLHNKQVLKSKINLSVFAVVNVECMFEIIIVFCHFFFLSFALSLYLSVFLVATIQKTIVKYKI